MRVAKFHQCLEIIIFYGSNQYRLFSKLLFNVLSISKTIEIYEKYTQDILKSCVKNISGLILFHLSAGLEILHS